MHLLEIEKKLILEFIKDNNQNYCSFDEKIEEVIALERRYTGVGFFTELCKCDLLKIKNDKSNYIWDKFGALINNKTEVCLLLYIEKGYIATIECATYAEDWPTEIQNFKLYRMNYNN